MKKQKGDIINYSDLVYKNNPVLSVLKKKSFREIYKNSILFDELLQNDPHEKNKYQN